MSEPTTTVYAVVDMTDFYTDVFCLYTFSKKKAEEKLKELRNLHPEYKYDIQEIQVEDSIFIRLSKMSYRKQKRKSPK